MNKPKGDHLTILNIATKVFGDGNIFKDCKESRRFLIATLNTIPCREAMVLILLNVSAGISKEECGNIMGVCPERIRQIEARGYMRLRHPRYSRGLREFLDK